MPDLPSLASYLPSPPRTLRFFDLGDARFGVDAKLPRATQGSGKAVIAHVDEQAAGVVANEVHDLIYLREEALQAAPAALREQHEQWIVNETVMANSHPDYETRHARSLSSILSRKRARKQTNRCASFTLTV